MKFYLSKTTTSGSGPYLVSCSRGALLYRARLAVPGFDTIFPDQGKSISIHPLGLRQYSLCMHRIKGSYDLAHAAACFSNAVGNECHALSGRWALLRRLHWISLSLSPRRHRNRNAPAEQSSRDRNSYSGPTIDLLLLFARRSFPSSVWIDVSVSGVGGMLVLTVRKRSVG